MSGRLFLLSAALLWSTAGLFAKAPVFEVWPPEVRGPLMAFWRALFAGLLLLPLVRRPRWRPALVPMAMSFAGMNLTYLSAMALTTAANAIWLQSTAPVWVLLLGVLMLGEPIVRRNLLLLGFGMAGVAIILFFELRQSGELVDAGGRLGVMLALVAGMCYAGVVLMLRKLREENGAFLVVVNHLVAAAILAPYVLQLGVWPNAAQLATLAAFGLFQMGVPYVLFARGLRQITSQEASGIVLIEPVLVPVWVLLAWGETPSWWTIVGGGFILAGLLARYVRLGGRQREMTD